MLMKETGWSLLEQMRCLPQIDECPTPNHHLIMNIILWNCRGALNPHFQRTVADLVNRHSPAVLIITETRIGGDRAKEITSRLPFDGVIIADTIGFAGGIWLLWNSDRVDVAQLACTEQEIHATIKVRSSNLSWLISSIYASPRVAERKVLWSNLVHTASLHHLPWLLLGDFNEVLCSDDKFGGLPVNFRRAFNFKSCLDMCGMIDLGFHGPRFTWSNFRELSELIQERLDRCFANSSWRTLFPEASVHHLTRTHSDHCPVLLCLDKSPSLMLPRPFRLQPVWMSHPSFSEVVDGSWLGTNPLRTKISVFTESAKVWNKEVFGNLVHKKSRLEARLRGIQVSLASESQLFSCEFGKATQIGVFGYFAA
jgi:exonuclease III